MEDNKQEMTSHKMSFSKLVFGESVIQGFQMVKFKGKIPIVFHI
jgi:hypothetical protein